VSKGTSPGWNGCGECVTLAPVAQDRLGSIGKFYLYGQERPSATANDTEKFTGYFRDAATGLDYADQRYEQPGVGRFMTSDPSGDNWDPANPGSWNTYAYVLGDPINWTDPSGLCIPLQSTLTCVGMGVVGVAQVTVGIATLVGVGSLGITTGGLAAVAGVVAAGNGVSNVLSGVNNIIQTPPWSPWSPWSPGRQLDLGCFVYPLQSRESDYSTCDRESQLVKHTSVILRGGHRWGGWRRFWGTGARKRARHTP
jgi:RHS repeat-associated protein